MIGWGKEMAVALCVMKKRKIHCIFFKNVMSLEPWLLVLDGASRLINGILLIWGRG